MPVRSAGVRMGLALFGVAYLFFVIYGSLVPLIFRPMPWDRAIEAFKAIPFLELGIGSRADWVANLLLFIPLAFFWCGIIWPQKHPALRVLACLVVGMACIALAFAIEFTQLFFPQRTVSVNDIVAESLGGVLGVWLWWQTGARFSWWLGSLRMVRGIAGVAERLLVVYLLLLVGYNLLPLDLTLSPVELYHKWAEGRIWLVPFGAPYDNSAHMMYALLSDVAIWIPAALLWKMAYRQPGSVMWIYVVAAAATIELLQLFVYSRVTDSTDIITAAIGGLIGLALMPKRQTRNGTTHEVKASAAAFGMPMLWLAVIVWLGVIAIVFWYPFEFNFDRASVRERLITLKQVPFTAYYYGSEFRAITELMHKTGFMLPLGVLLGWITNLSSARVPRAAWHAIFVTLMVSVACTIEFGQLFLPAKFADLTDVMLEVLGGITGYWGCLFVFKLLRQPSHTAPT